MRPAAAVGLADFSAAVLDPDRPVPVGLRASQRPSDRRRGASATKRFAVYRNNVVSSLIDALAARFPVSQRLLGEEFFRAMARVFVLAHPPRSKLLIAYGDDLPAFLHTFAPARGVPYVADVATLEAAVARAHHAADATPVAIDVLAGLSHDALGRARLVLHPSLERVASAYPIVSLFERNLDGGRPDSSEEENGLDLKRGEDALVVRPELEVEVRRLPKGGCAFVAALAEGTPLGEAAGQVGEEEFDLAANIAGLFGAGGVIEVEA